ncbi:WXG100 family type VII secretion target [Nocardia alni]|uniref:WXG100 family type VII secretion target n=1 Tax=Nocardia alni TaxID=2815723 RepID=UPI001C21BDF8|nr:WXG100 family type VII secretion target [Nocardia alni]
MTTPAPDGYRVDLEHLDQVTTHIANLRGFVADSLTGLDQRISAAHQQWSGAAAEKHLAAHREWMNAAQRIKDGIETMHTAAKTAHAAYTDGLAANRKTLGA